MIGILLFVFTCIIVQVVLDNKKRRSRQEWMDRMPGSGESDLLIQRIQGAMAGDPGAETYVIEAYLLGRGTQVNPVEAMAWLHHIGDRMTDTQRKTLALLEERHGEEASRLARARAADIPDSPFHGAYPGDQHPRFDNPISIKSGSGTYDYEDLGLEPHWGKERKRAHLLKEFARANSRMQVLRNPGELAECQARLDRITRLIMHLDGGNPL